MHTTPIHSQTVSDNAAARSVTAARVVSVRELRRRLQLARAAAQGEAQGVLMQRRIAKARTLAIVAFLYGAAA
jgi:hypothetical protein